ncbi:hypothetical protein JOS77_16955 [Chromobacterium haemolyticum]|nr:hypothetical protein JOS77_16955 [Chromobacterium haemolyticum]
MKKISFLLCFLVSLLFSSFSFSQPVSRSWPVSKVYRADSRPPEDVFKNGFSAWGININFNAHVLGLSGSSGSRDSAFIPTTSAESIAQRFATDLRNVSSQGCHIFTT